MAEPSSDESAMGAFLESLQLKKASQAASRAPTSPISLLDLLSAGPRPVTELQKESGMEFSDFAVALKSVVDAGFVTLSGSPGDETAALTASGAALVAMKS